MRMLATLAWKNIWRSRTRTLVVIGAAVVGVWALVFLLGFFQGQINNYINNVIQNETSHFQIHHPKFGDDLETRYIIPHCEEIEQLLQEDPLVDVISARILLNGMLASSNAAQGVRAKGIEMQEEAAVTHFDEKIVEGSALQEGKKNQIIISQRMAEMLKVKIRSKVVLTFQNADQEITSAAFRVVGLYRTNKRMNDELYVYAAKQDLIRLAELPETAAHEIAVVSTHFDQVDAQVARLASKIPNASVESYRQLAPDLDLMNNQIKVSMTLMITIFMLALIFGIINTMLMAVLERTKELGMLMAIGMNKSKVFMMVCLETLLVSLIGAPIGMLLGYLTNRALNHHGINLSRWSTALEQFGMSDIVRPVLDTSTYLIIGAAMVFTGVLASIYPSLKATKLRPVQALRKI